MKQTQHYDLIIIGGGIAGGMLAASMARNGVKTLILEGGIHPKFAIGESMILETSEIMRSMALAFDVPELEVFSSEYFLPVAGTSHGVKRHFSFMNHNAHEEPKTEDLVQAVIPKHPYGHELHLYRQDTDYYYLAVARKYGADILQNEKVTNVEISDEGVSVDTANGAHFSSDYIVDAGGHNSLLANKFDLRKTDGLQTHTRSIFTHMVGVNSFHTNNQTPEELGIPFSLSEGTHHHVFEGGWMWVIPFNNHKEASNNLCSVGLLLDPRIHPIREDLTPEEEFNDFIARYPAMQRHLDGASTVRNWVRTPGRIQYTAKECVGERFCLLGHAAGFIDPLFSKGLYSSLASIFAFGQKFLQARKTGNYSRNQFLSVEKTTLNYVASNDRLVANAIKSFGHAPLWRQYSVMWLTGAYLELIKLTTFRQTLKKKERAGEAYGSAALPDLKLIGGGYAPYEQMFEKISGMIERLDMSDKALVDQAVAEMHGLIQNASWIPESHRAISAGAKHLPKNKYKLSLLTREGGLLGKKPYREHFFNDTNSLDLAMFLAKDAVRYAKPTITARHKRSMAAGI